MPVAAGHAAGLFLSLLLASPAWAANIAPQATASASSQAFPQTAAVKAIDGVIAGYPANWTAEWVSAGEGAGAWLELLWPTQRQINSVVLYDRPNLAEQITSGRLEFDAGAPIAVTALPNDGSALTLYFPARTTTSLRFVVVATRVFPTNIGLAEIEVMSATAAPTCPCEPMWTNTPVIGWSYSTPVLGFRVYVNNALVRTLLCTGGSCPEPPFPALQKYGDWPPGTVVLVEITAFNATEESPRVAMNVCMPCWWAVPAPPADRLASYQAARGCTCQ